MGWESLNNGYNVNGDCVKGDIVNPNPKKQEKPNVNDEKEKPAIIKKG